MPVGRRGERSFLFAKRECALYLHGICHSDGHATFAHDLLAKPGTALPLIASIGMLLITVLVVGARSAGRRAGLRWRPLRIQPAGCKLSLFCAAPRELSGA